MRQSFRHLSAGCLLAILLLTSDRPVRAGQNQQPQSAGATSAKPSDEKVKTDASEVTADRQLKPEVAALRDQVRRTLAQHQKQPFNTRDNLPTEIMAFCLGGGCGTEILLEGPGGKKINAITCLCWNYPCAGFEMLGAAGGHLSARIGYGYQEHPGEFIAMLAMSRVPPTYPIRSGKTTRTVADLAEAEKLGCRAGGDMSLKLIGLSYYVEEPNWKNDLGEEWSLERVVRQEIAQPIVTAPDGGLNRLLGLSYAVDHRLQRGLPIDGQCQRAQKYVSDFHDRALAIQNSDGSWGPYLLTARSTSADGAVQLRATGRVLEWLAVSLPVDRLTDPRVVRAVEYVTRLLNSQRYYRGATSLSTREIGAFGHALHALATYDERVFKPADAETQPVAEKVAAQ